MPPFWEPRQRNVATVVASEQLIDELIHMLQLPARWCPMAHFQVVVVQGLKVLVHISWPTNQSEVKCSQHAHVLMVFILYKLDDDFLLGLDL